MRLARLILLLPVLLQAAPSLAAGNQAATLQEVIENIRTNYVEHPDTKKLFFSAIIGLRSMFDDLKIFSRKHGKVVVLKYKGRLLEVNQKDFDDLTKLAVVLERILDLLSRGTTWGLNLEYRLIAYMLNGLDNDPFTIFLTPQVYQRLSNARQDGLAQVGITIAPAKNGFLVDRVKNGSPAQKAGIVPGVKILAIDGKPTLNMTKVELISYLFGPPGSAFTLRFSSPEGGERSLMLVREKPWENIVEHTMVQNSILVLTIHAFEKGVAKKVLKILRNVRKQGLKGLVLDLRSNPGGFLTEGLAVASHFLPRGMYLASVHGADRDRKAEFRSDGALPKFLRTPLVVLVDGQSASVTELISLIMKKQKRGLLAGQNTFGKGTVQSIFDLADGSALKLTIARYYGPDRQPLKGHVIPDVRIACKPDGPKDREIEFATKLLLSIKGSPDVNGMLKKAVKLLAKNKWCHQ